MRESCPQMLTAFLFPKSLKLKDEYNCIYPFDFNR